MRRRAGLGARALVSCCAGVFACADPDSGPTETDDPEGSAEIRVSAVEGARMCMGTEQWLLEELPRVEAATGLGPAVSLPIVVGASAVAERCTGPDDPQMVLGCTLGDGGATEVITTLEVLSHELVHALRRHYELSTRALFEEGFADAIGGSDAYPRYVELDPRQLPESRWPEALVQQSKAEFRSAESYRVAAHFVDHLRAEHGTEVVAAFMRGGIDASAEAAKSRFEVHFEASLADEAQAWRDAGPQILGQGDPCTDGVEAIEPGLGVELVVRVDCDERETMGLQGAGEVAWIRRCVSLDAGRYAVELAASSGAVRWNAVPGSCAEGSSELDAAPKVIEAGDAGMLDFAACTWAVTFESTEDEPEGFSLALGPG